MPRRAAPPEPPEGGVPAELREEFERLEARIDEALEVIGRLRQENLELQQQLAGLRQTQAQVARRLDSVLDKIDELT